MLSGVGFTALLGAITVNNLSFALGFLIVVVFLARKLRALGGYTLPDYLGERFDSRFLRGFGALVVIISATVYLIGQTRAMGFIIQGMTGLTLEQSILLGATIFILYVALGGLLAVVWTNIAQFIMMYAGLALLYITLYGKIGGWAAMATKVEQVAPGWTSITGVGWAPMALISWYVVWIVAYFTRVEFVTKLYAARDPKVARYTIPIACALILLFFTPIIYFGGAARILVWSQVTSPDKAFPILINSALGPMGAAFAFAGLAAAAMSTTDSLLHQSGAGIAHDIIRKCLFEPNKVKKSEEFYVRVSRVTILGVGIIAVIGALYTSEIILKLVSYAVAMLGASFGPAMVFGLSWKRVSKIATGVSVVGGFVITAIWSIMTIYGVTWAKIVHPVIPGIIFSTIAIVVLSLILPTNISEKTLNRFF
jgi:SSS family transporter